MKARTRRHRAISKCVDQSTNIERVRRNMRDRKITMGRSEKGGCRVATCDSEITCLVT